MQEEPQSIPSSQDVTVKERSLSAWEAAIDARWRRITARTAALLTNGPVTPETAALLNVASQRCQGANELRCRMVEQRTTSARILDAHASEAELLLERARLSLTSSPWTTEALSDRNIRLPSASPPSQMSPIAPSPPAVAAGPASPLAVALTTVEEDPGTVTQPYRRARAVEPSAPTPSAAKATASSAGAPAGSAKAPPQASKPAPAATDTGAGQSLRAGIERREHRRVAIDVDVTMSSDHNFFVGFTENISEGGLFIATHRLLPMGTVLDVTFRLSAGEPINVRAKVCWVRQYNADSDTWPGMGVTFVDIDAADHRRVLEFLAIRDPLFHALGAR